MVETRGQKLGGLAATVVFVGTGAGDSCTTLVTGFLFGYSFTGITWCAVGLSKSHLLHKRHRLVLTQAVP